MSSFDFVKFQRKFVDVFEWNWHESNDGFSDRIFSKFFFFQESGSNVKQSIFRPWEEPIDNSAVDKSRELSGSSSQWLSNWREADRHVKFLFDLINVPIPAVCVVSGVNFSFWLDFTSDIVDDFFLFFRCIQLGNLAWSKEIVDIDKKSFISDLTFSE